ncbi:MAG: hypothetical protein AAB478_02030 [Patescibacteria group bacterium]|mgnify:CR=1 FL=1
MAKKRKTRSQKIAAELKRQNLTIQAVSSPSLPLTLPTFTQPVVPTKSVTHNLTQDYHFVRHDLIKTMLITTAVIVVELVLSFLMR